MSEVERPPFISFETREVEDRAATQANGFYTSKSVDYAIVIPLGTKDKIERVVSEYDSYLDQCVRAGRFQKSWLDTYRAEYKAWKAGYELPPDGFPLLNWPVMSPGQRSLAIGIGLRTVQDLAAANEETIRRLGMGGRALIDKAKEFLQASEPAKLVEKVVDLEMKLKSALELIEQLSEVNKSLQAKLEQPA